MTLTQDQYDSLLAKYVDSIVDGMDMDTLLQFASDMLEQNLRESCSLDVELIEEISRFNDESDVAAMIEDVGGNPADFDIHNHLDDELTDEQIEFLKNAVKKD